MVGARKTQIQLILIQRRKTLGFLIETTGIKEEQRLFLPEPFSAALKVVAVR